MAKRRAQGEGSVTQRADGRWEGRLHLGYEAGKRLKKCYYGSSQESVQKQLLEARHALSKGVAPVTGRVPTIAEFGATWIETSVKLTAKPRSAEGMETILTRHISPALGKVRLDKLQPAQVQRLLASKLAEGLSPQTVKHVRVVLSSMLNKAMRLGLIARNPASAAFIDTPRIIRREAPVLDAKQAQHLLNCAQGHRYEGIFALGISTGMRKGEVCALRWSDVDFVASVVHINQTISRQKSGSQEPGKRTIIRTDECKTTSSRRTIALPEFVTKLLKARRAIQAADRLKAGERWQGKDDLIFTDVWGRPIHNYLLHLAFKALLKQAELPVMRIHDLRHTAASLLLAQGCNIKQIQGLLGHSSIVQTLSTYAHLQESSKGETADLMATLLKRV